jgi:hypothetical protein
LYGVFVWARSWALNSQKRHYPARAVSKTGSCLHLPEWAALVGMPAVDAILAEVRSRLYAINLYNSHHI